MNVKIKLLADFRQYLPKQAKLGQYEQSFAAGSTIATVLQQLPVPNHATYFVMLNNELVSESAYADTPLQGNDELAIFPPVKAG